MNYKLIVDQEKTEKYINLLPDCNKNEMFYLALFARKKYDAEGVGLRGDKCQLKRTTATKDRIIQKIAQWETAIGTYVEGDIIIPQETLAVYITPNPRDLHKASLNYAKNMLIKLAGGQDLGNPRSMSMNAIQTSCSKKRYFDIDIDTKGEEILDKVRELINPEAISPLSVETRGGYHILIELDRISPPYKNIWYKNFETQIKYNIFEGQMNGDGLCPIPGCTQGGFTTKTITII